MRVLQLLICMVILISPVLAGGANNVVVHSDIKNDGTYIQSTRIDTNQETPDSIYTLGTEFGTKYREMTLVNNAQGKNNQITHDFEVFEPNHAGESTTVNSQKVMSVEGNGMIHEERATTTADGYFPMNNTSLEDYSPWTPTYESVTSELKKTFITDKMHGVSTTNTLNGGVNSPIPGNDLYEAPMQVQQAFIGKGHATGLSKMSYDVNTQYGTTKLNQILSLEQSSMTGEWGFDSNFTANQTIAYNQIYRPNLEAALKSDLCPLVGVMA